MYLPCLYANPAQRGALLAFAPHPGAPQTVFPILERYSPPADLKRTLDAYLEAENRLQLVVSAVKPLRAISNMDAEQARSSHGRFLASPRSQAPHQYRVDGKQTNLARSKQQQIGNRLFTVAASI